MAVCRVYGHKALRSTSPLASWLACTVVLTVLANLGSPLSWVPFGSNVGRRQGLLQGAAAAVGLSAAASEAEATTGINQERFDGSYLQSGLEDCGETCSRTINANGGLGMVRGRDSASEQQWFALAEYQDKTISLDLSPLGGPKKYKGKWSKSLPTSGEKGILWEDGKEWEKMEYKIMATPYGGMGANSRSEAIQPQGPPAR
mmetsp:Transcript_9293/g.20810  ORF Transcript_9293/g.20810 Transcript_9293/m.20810 type:complete len:202 (+) Transcript_9293:140-745(+)